MLSTEKTNKLVIGIRRKIHRFPEMGQQEFRTTALVAQTLTKARVPHRRHKPTGVVGALGHKNAGPCVALRADMDALPIQESTRWPHQSTRKGIMHACGHDAHTAMVLTTALQLASEGANLPGQIKFIFQPDEEGAQGARQLIRQGAMTTPKVKAVFGIHVNPWLPAGTIGIKPGPLMAAVDRFTVEISGGGGHGAYPHDGRDAVLIASHAVTALQSIVSRRVDPVEPVVLTIGTVKGGHRFNVLAEKVVLTGTVRTLSEKWHQRIPKMMQQVLAGVIKSHGGQYKLIYERLTRPLHNHAAMASLAREVAVRTLGSRKVLNLQRPTMGGEDFPEYLQRAPGCFIFLGTGQDKKTKKPWHHPEFFLHEKSMLVGVKFLTALAKNSLTKLS